MLGEPLAERLREIGHRREIGDAAMIDPVPQLAGAEFFGPELGHLGGDFGAPEPDQIAAGQGRRRFVYGRTWRRYGPRCRRGKAYCFACCDFCLFFFAMFFHTFLGDILCADAFLGCVAAFAGARLAAAAAVPEWAGRCGLGAADPARLVD